MFSNIPPVINLQYENSPAQMVKAFQIFHSTVSSPIYRSRGSERRNEQHCIFHYTVRGRGEVIYNGTTYRTKSGEGFFNIINDVDCGYGYPSDSSEPWEYIVICFKGGNVREAVREMLERKVVFNVKNTSAFSAMCNKLLDPGNHEMKLTFFARLVSLLLESETKISETVFTFQNIVEQDILKNPTISAIASRMHMSREHLQREYFKQTGKTPAKYISDKRFEILCNYLSSGKNETEIARIMNFPSVSGMTAFFKKYSGITPRQYRKNGFISI